jgi:hypothetical protein
MLNQWRKLAGCLKQIAVFIVEQRLCTEGSLSLVPKIGVRKLRKRLNPKKRQGPGDWYKEKGGESNFYGEEIDISPESVK